MAGNHGNCISGAWLYTVKLLLATSVMVSSSSGIRTQRSGLFTHDASHATALNPLETREWRNGEYCNIWAVRLLISRLLIGGIVVPYIHLMHPICRTQLLEMCIDPIHQACGDTANLTCSSAAVSLIVCRLSDHIHPSLLEVSTNTRRFPAPFQAFPPTLLIATSNEYGLAASYEASAETDMLYRCSDGLLQKVDIRYHFSRLPSSRANQNRRRLRLYCRSHPGSYQIL